MKLPEIEYQIPLQSPVQAAGAPWEAAGKAADVFAAGFQMLGQERIKTQAQEAAVQLTEKLSKAEEAVKKRQFFTTDEVEQLLGKDGVPEHVRPYFAQVDPDTGKPALIPAYEVGDAIYKKQAAEAVSQASKVITTTGWQADFQARAAEHVQAKAQQLALHNLEAAGSYLEAQHDSQVERMINAGDFAGAKAIVASSDAMRPTRKEAWKGKILEAEQTKPALDAMMSEDPKVLQAEVERLRTSPAAAADIPEAKRRQLLMSVEGRLFKFEAVGIVDQAIQAGTVPGSLVPDEGKVFGAFQSLSKGRAPELQRESHTLLKARLQDIAEERKTKTAQVFAYALADFQAPGKDGKPRNRVAFIRPEVQAFLKNPANGDDAVKLWQTLLDKEKSDIRGDRELANMATPENFAAYTRLIKDLQDNPSKYRTMDPARFAAQAYADLGPLVKEGMTLYKSVNEPKPDQRHLTGDERKAMLEALPTDYRADSKTKPDSVKGVVWSEMEKRIGERKQAYLDGKPGPVPQTVVKEWVAEETAKVRVKGADWVIPFTNTGLADKDVPKIEAETNPAYRGKPYEGGLPKPAASPDADLAASIQAEWKARGLKPLTPAELKRAVEERKKAAP